MFGNFVTKALLKKQMKDIPEDQQEQFLATIDKNPDFFMKIAKEVQEKTKGGMSQQDATMKVMKEHEAELRAIVGK